MTTAQLSLEHLIRPSNITQGKAPVLFLFHGYGSNEEDLFSFAEELPGSYCVIAARAPHTLQPFGYAWYAINFEATKGKWSDHEQAKASRELIVRFMEEACETYHLDDKNVNLLGFSQGTVLSYAVALSYPEKIRNVVALSGYIDESVLAEGYEQKDHSQLNLYVSHGQMDMVIPPEWAQKSSELLDTMGITHTYEEFPVGHGVSPANFKSFSKWLDEHTKTT
ncbi:MAG: alpha/beta fold hydrolase [Flavobacteriaceae bacterium]|nr:alpha/beta fold hydrolase [Flavobacteriaceae bacterium]